MHAVQECISQNKSTCISTGVRLISTWVKYGSKILEVALIAWRNPVSSIFCNTDPSLFSPLSLNDRQARLHSGSSDQRW